MSTRHRWDSVNIRRVPAVDSPDGNDRTERDCLFCGMVKVTVHPPKGQAWRAWRTKDGKDWQGDATPPCLPAVAAEVKEVEFS